jgi:hypothetical protein
LFPRSQQTHGGEWQRAKLIFLQRAARLLSVICMEKFPFYCARTHNGGRVSFHGTKNFALDFFFHRVTQFNAEIPPG